MTDRLPPERLAALAAQLADFYRMLDGVDVVGYPKRTTELATLRTLIARYPDEAGAMLNVR